MAPKAITKKSHDGEHGGLVWSFYDYVGLTAQRTKDPIISRANARG